jgi:hypothetical protein
MIKNLTLTLMGLVSLLWANPPHNDNIKWTKLFDVKSLNESYVPQAIDVYKDYVLFSVHAKDAKSALIVFKKSPEKLEYLFEVDMPKEATHTSDFNVLDDTLYAIDYASNKIYEIDIPALIEKRELVIRHSFYLDMSRTGSLAIIKYKGEKYVLFTRFILSNKLIGFKMSELKKDKLDKSKIAFEITNNRFVQGLYVRYNMLLISTNNWGVDTITIVDIPKMMQTKDVGKSTIKSINAPFKMVEDITIYGNRILTSDEESNYIYESEDLTK